MLTGLLYYQIFLRKQQIIPFSQWFENLGNINLFWIALVFLLMFLNWGLEAFKWKYLLTTVKFISIATAIQSVFCGVSFSIFTPNRIGEYAGRILFLPYGYRIKGILIAIVSSISQMIITLSIGVIGFVLLVKETMHWNSIQTSVIIVFAIVFSIILIWIYFNLQVFRKWIIILKRFKLIGKIEKALKAISLFSNKQLLFVLSISLLRYIIYSVQFLILLIIFEVHFTFLEGIMGIPSIFLIQTLVPIPAIAELGWRGNVSIEILGLFSQNQYGILAATTLLWIINLIIPALAGSVFIFNSQILKQKE
jgi:uncharacterized membrane protein YbhN (UPF0104 family)